MTDHNDAGADHGHGEGILGHEVDDPPNTRLFNILIWCSLLVFLSCVALVQVFNRQRASIVAERSAQGSHVLNAYRKEMASTKGAIEAGKNQVAGNAAMLKAFPAPAGWVHPDDMVAGAAAPAPAVEGEGDGAESDGADSDGADSEGADGDVAEGDAPEGEPAGNEGADEPNDPDTKGPAKDDAGTDAPSGEGGNGPRPARENRGQGDQKAADPAGDTKAG